MNGRREEESSREPRDKVSKKRRMDLIEVRARGRREGRFELRGGGQGRVEMRWLALKQRIDQTDRTP